MVRDGRASFSLQRFHSDPPPVSNDGAPTVSLLALQFPTYPADALPPELAAIPTIKPGS